MRVTFTDAELRCLHGQGLTDEQLAARLGGGLATVGNRRRALDLPVNAGGRRAGVDMARLRALHAEGLPDRELAEAMGVSTSTIANRRLAAGLACNPARPRFDRDRLRALHAEGLLDPDIAARMGCSVEAARKQRRKMGLPGHGRRRLWDAARLDRMRALVAQGMGSAAVAREMGLKTAQVRDAMFRHGLETPQSLRRYTRDMDERIVAGMRAGELVSSIAARLGRTESSVQNRWWLLRKRLGVGSASRPPSAAVCDAVAQGGAAVPSVSRACGRPAHRVDLDRLAARHGAGLVQSLAAVQRAGAYGRLTEIAGRYEKPLRLVETIWHQVRA